MNIDSRRLIRHDGKLFIQIRAFRDRPGKEIDPVKEYLDADICLRNNGILFFCKEISEPPELEYVNDSLVVS